jgi:hypothetical protein
MALSRFCGENDIITGLNKEEEEQRLAAGGRTRQHDRWPLARCGWRQWRRIVRGLPTIDPHLRALDARRLVTPEQWQGYFKFAFVRNPWDRVVSQWFWRCQQEPRPTLAEFLYSKEMRSMHKRGRLIYTIDDKIVADRICRYEQMSEELDAIGKILGFPEPLVMPRAKGGHRKDRRHYSQWYDDKTRDAVAQMFPEEISAFGYTFEDRR